jgi:hypothetical protein
MNATRLIALVLLLAAILGARAASSVTFDNQSGETGLVKLVGPTSTSVQVETGKNETVTAAAGHYYIKVRYGTPGKYAYSKGDEFDVTETATSASQITITLHKVVAGNYGAHPIGEKEFVSDEPSTLPDKSKTSTTPLVKATPRLTPNDAVERVATEIATQKLVEIAFSPDPGSPSLKMQQFAHWLASNEEPLETTLARATVAKWGHDYTDHDSSIQKLTTDSIQAYMRMLADLSSKEDYVDNVVKNAAYLRQSDFLKGAESDETLYGQGCKEEWASSVVRITSGMRSAMTP